MSDLSLRFLGSGDAFSSGARLNTCFHVTGPEVSFLIDCGASALIAMKRWDVARDEIDSILITHFHGDHFGGIPIFILDAQIFHRKRPLMIAGPPGVEAKVLGAMDALFPGSAGVKRPFEVRFIEWEHGTPAEIGPLLVTPFEVVHSPGSEPHGLRIEVADRVIAYSGDSEWTESLIDVARGADVFISEAYTFDKRIRFHLDYATLLEKRALLGCKRIICTHMTDEMLARCGSLELECAEDGMVIEL